MKKIGRLTSIFLCFFIAALVIAGCGRKVAATVNGKEIYLEDVDKEVDRLLSQHKEAGGTQTEKMKEQFRGSVLNYLIENELALQEAEKKGIKVTDKEVEKQLNQMKKMFSSEAEFNSMLEKQDIDIDDFKERLREDLLMTKITEPLYKGLEVSDEEAKDYYEKNKTSFQDPEKVHLRQIVLGTKDKAEKMLSKVKSGEDFSELAKKNSVDAMTRDKGGDLDWKTKQELPQEMADAAFALEVGEVSDIIKTQSGYVIVKVEQKQPAKQQTFEESKENIKQSLLEQKKSKKYKKWIAKLKKKAKIKKLI